METISLEYIDVFDENRSKDLVFSKHLIKEPFKESSLFANLVDGKSMQPLIKDRAVIVVDISNREFVDEGIYLLYYEQKMWVKKYDMGKQIFYSINPEFSHLVYKQDEVHLVGKVLLTFTNL